MDSRLSSPATAFEKSLRSFETGGVTYGDFLADLKQMLAAGASATDLQDVLGRRQGIEPMAEDAYSEVAGILSDAARAAPADSSVAETVNPSAEGIIAAPEAPVVVKALRNSGMMPMPGGRPRPTGRIPSAGGVGPQLFSIPSASPEAIDAGTASRAAELAGLRGALEAAQNKTRQITEAARSRMAEALRETENLRDESRRLRESLAERETQFSALQREHASIAPALEARAGSLALELTSAQHALAERSADLAARDAALAELKKEHGKALRVHEARASSRGQLESDLQTARRALDEQQQKTTADAALFAEKLATAAAAREQSEGALRAAEQQLRTADQQLRAAELLQTGARQLRETLTARDSELAGVRQEHAKTTRIVEERAVQAAQLQAELAAARARADAVKTELEASQDAAARLVADLKRREAELESARAEIGAVKLQSNSYLETLRNRDWRQGYEQSRDTTPQPDPAPRLEPVPAAAPQPAAPSAAAPSAAAPPRLESRRRTSRAVVLAMALLIIIGMGWWIAHHESSPPVAAAPSAAIPFTPGSVIQDCATCPTVTVLPTGRFKQGSAPADAGYSAFEGPQHWVMLSRPFALSTNPVTVEQFARFVEATGRDMQGCDTYDGAWKSRPDSGWKSPGFVQTNAHPVTCVSFDDATAYAQWLSVQTGHTYRLPSGSEWEFAALAGGTAVQPWGSGAEACTYANVADASAAHRYPGWRVFACNDGFVNTSPVGSFQSNAFGLNDMLGNVFQWTQDCWNGDYSGAPVDGSARSSGDCGSRELRGGSWFSSPRFVRATYRNQFAVNYRTSTVGIRLVREL